MHALFKVALLIVTSGLYTFLILRRPNAPQTVAKSVIGTHLAIGLVIGLVFLETTRWYVTHSAI